MECLHPKRDDGSELDATFELTVVPVFDLVFHHKEGGRGSARATNQDYHEALEALVSRLSALRATILGISVDSSVARRLDAQDRELALAFPIALNEGTNAHALRLEITRAQKRVARQPTAKPGGGNDQKRIRITLSFEGEPVALDQLASLLVNPHHIGAGFESDKEQTECDATMTGNVRSRADRRARTPQHEFHVHILSVLDALGGSGSTQHVVDAVGARMSGSLTEEDCRAFSSGELRWRNSARWARKDLVDAGFLSSGSPHGLWELTELGRHELARLTAA